MLKYIKGDATSPIGEGKKFIIHVCNDCGRWGRGFVLALSKKWKEPEQRYREWYWNSKRNTEKQHCFYSQWRNFLPLGEVQFVRVENDIAVANMIGQHGTGEFGIPIDYNAIRKALKFISETYWFGDNKFSIHAPKFGSGLAGGKWKIIEQIIIEELVNKGIEVTIYEL